MTQRPILAATMGDPAGIGSLDPELTEQAVVVGDAAIERALGVRPPGGRHVQRRTTRPRGAQNRTPARRHDRRRAGWRSRAHPQPLERSSTVAG